MPEKLDGFDLVDTRAVNPLYPGFWKLFFIKSLQTKIIQYGGEPQISFQIGEGQTIPFLMIEKNLPSYDKLLEAAKNNDLYVICVNLPEDGGEYILSKWTPTNHEKFEDLFRELLALT